MKSWVVWKRKKKNTHWKSQAATARAAHEEPASKTTATELSFVPGTSPAQA